jgi:hypothetical protein
MSRAEVLTETMHTLFRTEFVKETVTEVLKENVTVFFFKIMFESTYVTHFVLHIRCEGKRNTVCSNRSYEGERNALFCHIQVNKGKIRHFVSNKSYKGNNNTFYFEQKLRRK